MKKIPVRDRREEDTDKEKTCKDRGGSWSDAANQTPGAPRTWKRQGRILPLDPLEEEHNHDFGLLGFRTVRE